LTKPPVIDDEYGEFFAKNYTPLRFSSKSFNKFVDESEFDLTKHFLLDKTSDESLIKRLDKIRLADNKFQREYGVSGAWLLGPFLCWRGQSGYKPDEIMVSPIFKLPLDIIKNKQKKWKLKLEDNELQINPTLRLALRQKWGITLPETVNAESAQEVLLTIRDSIVQSGKKIIELDGSFNAVPKIPPRFKIVKDEDGNIVERVPVVLEDVLSKKDLGIYSMTTDKEFVLLDAIYMDHLNASRTVLLRDYDEILNDEEMHSILSEMFLGKPVSGKQNSDYREHLRSLDSYEEKENYFVVGIDSSQHAAIDQTKSDRVVVIQGPPGTGKSQTITNMIADALARNMRVLFVSEKRAALDVVHSRIKHANLGAQTVLIHGSSFNKKELYNSFVDVAESIPDFETDEKWIQGTQDLDKNKSELNQYYEVLQIKHSPSDLVVSDLLSISADQASKEISNFDLVKKFSGYTYAVLKKIAGKLDQLKSMVDYVPGYSNHPWRCKASNVIYTDTFVHSFKAEINKLKDAEMCLENAKASLEQLGVEDIKNMPDTSVLHGLTKTDISSDWARFASAFYVDSAISFKYLKENEEIFTVISDGISDFKKITGDADAEIVRKLELYYAVKRELVDWFTPVFWEMRKYRCQYLEDWDGTNQVFKVFRLVNESVTAFNNCSYNEMLPFSVNVNNPEKIINHYEEIRATVNNSVEIANISNAMNPEIYTKFMSNGDLDLRLVKEFYSSVIKAKEKYDRLLTDLSSLRKSFYLYFNNDVVLEDL
tara:strand:- start:1313 stop:3613 length:2301 start_codon:yes stop_codon:yes gene_type:complete